MRVMLFILVLVGFSLAQLKIVATYPWIGELVKEIGKDKVKIHIIAKGTDEPHFVVPKPSHIAKMRDANLLIIQGASIEIGFLPPLLQQSNNPKIQPSREGFLDLSQFVELIEKPQRVSREMGDVHPEGNPHYNLDPHNIPILARAVAERMCQLDSPNCSYHRANLEDFLGRWNAKLKEWDREFSKLRGTKVISYHKLYDYFLSRYGIVLVGTLEPLPGIPPTAKHIENLTAQAQGVKFILQDVYHEKRTAEYLAKRLNAKVLILPNDVGAVPEAKDLFSLFDEILRRFSQ